MHHTARRLTRALSAASVLTVALLPISGCGSGTSAGSANQAAATTVTITEKMGPPDRYSFSPTTLELSKGASLAVENKTDEDHSIACTPDAGTGMVEIDKDGTRSATFAVTGTFTCRSTEHPEATLSVTVK